MSETRDWKWNHGVIPQAKLSVTDVLSVQITEYTKGRAVWYVWIGESNVAALSGTSPSIAQAQQDLTVAVNDLCRRIPEILVEANLINNDAARCIELHVRM